MFHRELTVTLTAQGLQFCFPLKWLPLSLKVRSRLIWKANFGAKKRLILFEDNVQAVFCEDNRTDNTRFKQAYNFSDNIIKYKLDDTSYHFPVCKKFFHSKTFTSHNGTLQKRNTNFGRPSPISMIYGPKESPWKVLGANGKKNFFAQPYGARERKRAQKRAEIAVFVTPLQSATSVHGKHLIAQMKPWTLDQVACQLKKSYLQPNDRKWTIKVKIFEKIVTLADFVKQLQSACQT